MTLPIHPIAGVCIPVYNYGDKVERAIESVMEQTMNNLRCVIVDDGSTDNTREVVKRLIASDSRFHYIYQPNAGVANARNRGVFSQELGRPKYITCLDADDKLDPRFLEVCVGALEADRTIDIAYTGLYYITPDGREGLSDWPGEYNYDKQLLGHNQIPTCNLARFKVWERLGGQRQRYAPEGAGEEDAEMWLRAGAYGFRAKKVTTFGLFIYSWQSGRVSGNTNHAMTDYRSWHPWVKDNHHPFASIATPEKKFSHPVRQYDEPAISVIIPVGPGHEKHVVTALDSLDAQGFRKWEACVWWDSPDLMATQYIQRTFPHIRLGISTDGPCGAGRARNEAVKMARAPLLVFLDADDWLLPGALQALYSAWTQNKKIAYSDYYGLAQIDEKMAQSIELDGRLTYYNKKSGDAVISHRAFDYECPRAIVQPNPQDMYIWGLVTMIVPRSWHDEIGGYDEDMRSWEDWDYQIRLARAGKCFIRVPGQYVAYRFATGNRREDGLRNYGDLVKYMTDKYARSKKTMGCGCKGNAVAEPEPTMQIPSVEDLAAMSDGDFVLIQYNHPNSGQHRVIGPASGQDYGYRGGGEQFIVHVADVNLMPGMFVPLSSGSTSDPVDMGDAAVPVQQTPPPPDLAALESAEPVKVKRTRRSKD